jgi:hypothetical protein
MRISERMGLEDLMEHMGFGANLVFASAFRDLLVRDFNGEDTKDVPESDWFDLLDMAENT